IELSRDHQHTHTQSNNTEFGSQCQKNFDVGSTAETIVGKEGE
ncbi:unnamed protein product, partial [marine sediment metagenome]